MMRHKYSIFFGLAVVVLLSQCIITDASAQTTSINGWTNQGSSGYDFYFTPSTSMDGTELCLLVNYETTAITVTDTEGNQTIFSQVIAPHASAFMVLPFPDVQTSYKVTVINQGYALLKLSVSTPGYFLPTQIDDSTWHIAPPANANNTGLLKYTQSAVNELLSMLTITVLICVLLAVVIGIMLGSMVKKSVLFFVPKDLISIIVYIVVFTDLIFNWTGLRIGVYYIPFIAGYVLGFFLTHMSYIEAEVLDLGGKARAKQPYVLYSPNEEVGHCIQQQSNKALIKRWLGYHHRLGMDGPLSPDLADSAKYPYFPLFRKQVLCIEDAATDYHDEPIFFGLFNVRVYTTYWRLSNVCKFPKAQWIASSATIIWARDLIQRLTADLVKERQTNHMEATHVAADMLGYTVDRSTHRAIYEKFNTPTAPLTIPKPVENVMRDITATVSRPQQTPQDTEPEETEKDRKRNNDIEDESEPAMDREDDDRNSNKNDNKKRRN